jgi:hypothetical protein
MTPQGSDCWQKHPASHEEKGAGSTEARRFDKLSMDHRGVNAMPVRFFREMPG